MAIAKQDTVGDLTKLLGLVKGTSTSGSTTSTSSSNISKDGMQALINQILGGSQGLAAISSGQKSAGLYGSTTNQMLTNDLVTQASQKLAAAQAGTTTTQSSNQKVAPPISGGNLMQMLALLGGGKLLGPTIKAGSKKLGLDSMGDDLANFLLPESVTGAGTGIGSSGSAGLLSSVNYGSDFSAIGSFADPLNAGTPTAGFDVAGSPTSTNLAMAASGLTGAESAGILGSFETAGATLGASEVGLAGGIGSFAAETGVADALAGFGGLELGSAAAGIGEVAGTAVAAAEGGGILASIGAAISEAVPFLAALFSDERLKTDIKPVGATTEGQTIYTYKYKDNPLRTHMGVLAQETIKLHPEAVLKHPSGALMVDYDKILGVD